MHKLAVSAVLAILLGSLPLQAQITVHSSFASWLGAIGPQSYTIEDFTSSFHFPLGSSLNSSTSFVPSSGTPINPGDIEEGVTYFVGQGALVIDQGAGFTGGFLHGMKSFGAVGPLVVQFDGAVQGFGFLTNSALGITDIAVSIFQGSSTFSTTFAPNGISFIGFTSAVRDIEAVTIGYTGITSTLFAVDDFAFTTPGAPVSNVPEPGTLGLLAVAGLTLVRFGRRRQV